MRIPWRWKCLKWDERLLWCLGLRAYHRSFGFRRALFWRVLADAVAMDYAKQTEEQRKRLESEMARMKSSLDQVVPKLVNISEIRPMPGDDRYRLVIDFDPFMIREGFMHGNDDASLRYFCEGIGHQVFRELKTCNLHRFADAPFNRKRYPT